MAEPPISKACRGGGTRSFFARSARGFLTTTGPKWSVEEATGARIVTLNKIKTAYQGGQFRIPWCFYWKILNCSTIFARENSDPMASTGCRAMAKTSQIQHLSTFLFIPLTIHPTCVFQLFFDKQRHMSMLMRLSFQQVSWWRHSGRQRRWRSSIGLPSTQQILRPWRGFYSSFSEGKRNF